MRTVKILGLAVITIGMLLGLAGCTQIVNSTPLAPIRLSGQEVLVLLQRVFPAAHIRVTHTQFRTVDISEFVNFIGDEDTDTLSFPCPQFRKVVRFLKNTYSHYGWDDMVSVGMAAKAAPPGWFIVAIVRTDCSEVPRVYGVNPANDYFWLIGVDMNVEEVTI